jgi:hypothetical protein
VTHNAPATVGNNLNTFLNRLIVDDNNAPNTNLWVAVCNGYRSAVLDFTNAIKNSLQLLNETNNIAPSFNPFTNQFLSLVVRTSTNMIDGPYSVASVTSVSAITCSPTRDGMPIYFLDQNALRRLDTSGMVITLAGGAQAGFRDGRTGLLNNPRGLEVSLDGTVYIADAGNAAIRAYNTNGLRTLAGFPPGTNNAAPVVGATDGQRADARFNRPRGLLINHKGNLLVADTMNHAIREVTPAGFVTTFAGTLGTGGLQDGLTVLAAQAKRNRGVAMAQFWFPESMVADTNDLLYVVESGICSLPGEQLPIAIALGLVDGVELVTWSDPSQFPNHWEPWQWSGMSQAEFPVMRAEKRSVT